MSLINWLVVLLFVALIILMSYVIGRSQKNQEDYYLGSRRMPSWLVGSSLMSNQVSAISLIGAPAFIAVKTGGGLIWLQYELAIPLAMIFIMLFLVPVYWKSGGITIYEFLEKRYGAATRSALSLIFLASRSMGAGVILLATSYVTSLCIGLPLTTTIILIGIISLVYTTLGGIKADIYTDFVQLIILWSGSIVCIIILIAMTREGISPAYPDITRLRVFDFSSSGFGDGSTFSFWPMLFGGFFLYISYYGCDQSQAQRLLSTRSSSDAKKALLFNGILRFPLVFTYCAIGVLMIPFMVQYPEFAAKMKGLPPDYLMPLFFTSYVPEGILGLIVAGILAASMSSLDSTINSLSAATWEDFLTKLSPDLKKIEDSKKVLYSRIITILWGLLSTGFAVRIAGGSETVIELVNKIGSAFYGPIAGIFVLGIVTKKTRQNCALAGLVAGVSSNIVLWTAFESNVSWMWWNVIGFAVTVSAGYAPALLSKGRGDYSRLPESSYRESIPFRYAALLIVWFILILSACAGIDYMFR